MRLFTRYNRLNLLSTVIIFVLTSIAYYFLLRFVIVNQLDDDLKIEKDEILTYAARFNKLPEIIPVKDQVISFTKSDASSKDVFLTVSELDVIEKETSEFRKLYFSFKADNNWHRAMVGKSMEGTENLIQSIIVITIITIL